MWFLALIPNVAWKWLGILGIIGAVFAYADIRATVREHAKCEAAAKAAQAAADNQDLKAEKEGRAQDLEITNNLVNQKKVDDEALKKLKADIGKNPLIATCTYPVVPARSVRHPWGTKPGARHP